MGNPDPVCKGVKAHSFLYPRHYAMLMCVILSPPTKFEMNFSKHLSEAVNKLA